MSNYDEVFGSLSDTLLNVMTSKTQLEYAWDFGILRPYVRTSACDITHEA